MIKSLIFVVLGNSASNGELALAILIILVKNESLSLLKVMVDANTAQLEFFSKLQTRKNREPEVFLEARDRNLKRIKTFIQALITSFSWPWYTALETAEQGLYGNRVYHS